MEARSLDPSDTHPTEPQSQPAESDSPIGRRGAAAIVFALIALTIGVTDQLLKSWITTPGRFEVDRTSPVVGDWLRIDLIHNDGGLFGLFQGQAILFAIVTAGVVAILVALEVGSGWRSWLTTITLGLLLGGAIGNFIDRIRFGYVVDFADIGMGTWRFPYIFNIADAAVTTAILLVLVLWFVAPHLGVQMPAERDGDRGKDADDAGRLKVR
jgi:signal peptidase II